MTFEIDVITQKMEQGEGEKREGEGGERQGEGGERQGREGIGRGRERRGRGREGRDREREGRDRGREGEAGGGRGQWREGELFPILAKRLHRIGQMVHRYMYIMRFKYAVLVKEVVHVLQVLVK